MALIRNLLIGGLTLIVALAATSVSASDGGMSIKEIASALTAFGADCDPKPEEEHIVEVVKNVEDAQYISKCFRHCLMAQFDLIQEGATILDKEKIVDMMSSFFAEREDELGAIIDACNDKNRDISEKCENAHAHGICIVNEMKERGFDLPEFSEE